MTIFGDLGLNDSDYIFNQTTGQRVIYDLAAAYVARTQADLMAGMSVFVEGTTTDFKEKYKLPGGGFLQKRNSKGDYGAVKANGGWDVAYPLEDWGASIIENDVDARYMTPVELTNHINTVVTQNTNTMRYEVLKSLLNNTAYSFVDERRGTLSVQPLANGDSVEYPPVLGSDDNATDNHYIETGYAASSISDTNDPVAPIVSELEEHFGTMTGGSNIAVFINNAQTSSMLDLTDFVSVTDMGIMPGDDTATVNALPSQLTTGSWRVLGRHATFGAWVVEWRWIPANYMLGIHLDAPAPLKRRIDPLETGLGDGLQLVATDEEFPFTKMTWRHRCGFGVGNRLNGVALELGTGGSYTVPTGYTR